MMNAKEIEAREYLDASKMYMSPETGSVDTGEGWVQDCIDPDYGFPCAELLNLLEVRKAQTAEERRIWGEWVPA